MQCVEFENRLNDLLDERLLPCVDGALVDRALIDHAQRCGVCAELLSAHDALLEGIQALPAIRLSDAACQALAHNVAMEVGSAPAEPFPVDHQASNRVELAGHRPTALATDSRASLALVPIVLAAAAVLLFAVLPWFAANDEAPQPPGGPKQLIADTATDSASRDPSSDLAQSDLESTGYHGLAPIARVGYRVADGLTPVTNSMVSALRELRKRPFFRNADEQGRSSSYVPHDCDLPLA